MRGVPLFVPGEVGLQALETGVPVEEILSWKGRYKWQKSSVNRGPEPTSVLDHQWPPSNSNTTTSSSIEESGKEEWASELQSILATPGLGVQDFEALQRVLGLQQINPGISFNPLEAMAGGAVPAPNSDTGPSFLASGTGFTSFLMVNSPPLPPSLAPNLYCQEPMIGPNLLHRTLASPATALVDQLVKAADLVEAGDCTGAHEILARLNHYLPSSPAGKPLLRSAFYFKEALHQLLINAGSLPTPPATALEVALKIDAYKAFSDISPILQFTHFTCAQSLLEVLDGADRVHIIDFDIGVGVQWPSFMQELAHQRCNAALSLRITAIVSTHCHHPLELQLTCESLSYFAAGLNIQFEFNVLSLDSFDPSTFLAISNGGREAIAVNLPVGSSHNLPFPSLLHLVRQFSPKIVFSVDHGYDRSDLNFSGHFNHAFQSCTVFLESIDALGNSLDVASKIERFLLQPRIAGAVLGHYHAAGKMLPWRTLFTCAGFIPAHFSNATEIQAECLVKRVQVRGFHVEKHQASLFLCWQQKTLVSVSAWRC